MWLVEDTHSVCWKISLMGRAFMLETVSPPVMKEHLECWGTLAWLQVPDTTCELQPPQIPVR